ncbi:hypothetical protein Tco_0187775, partial [Tanacetum coccineum]
KIRISGFPNEAEDCEALVIEGQIPRAREASKIRDILDNTAQNTTHGKGKRQASSQQLNTYSLLRYHTTTPDKLG